MKNYKMKSLIIALIFLLSSQYVFLSKAETKNSDIVFPGMMTGSVR